MKNTHTITATTLLSLLALTGCGQSTSNTTSAPETTTAATSASSASAASTSEAPSEENKLAKVGEPQAYTLKDNDAVFLRVTVDSVEPITAEQCNTSYFDGVPEGKQLVKLSVSAEAGTKETIEQSELGEDSIGFWVDDWGWVDSEGYKIQRPVNDDCIGSEERPANSLAAEQKTRGTIVLEIPASEDVSEGMPYYEAYWAPFPLEWEQ